ncbi:MAG: hypothetical protein HY611_02670 [Elusimicrobia bacterium]|nr:hypothetical protein [Elusimicrobiota bacterium]
MSRIPAYWSIFVLLAASSGLQPCQAWGEAIRPRQSARLPAKRFLGKVFSSKNRADFSPNFKPGFFGPQKSWRNETLRLPKPLDSSSRDRETPDAVAEQAAARALLSLIAAPVPARLDEVPGAQERTRKLVDDDKKLCARDLARLFDGALQDASHGVADVAVNAPAQTPAAGAPARAEGSLINGRAAAGNILAAIEQNRTPVRVAINRNEHFILAAAMFVGTSFDSYATKAGGEIVWSPASSKSKALYDWLLIQPDRSVTPESLFLKSLEIAEGGVWEALASGWNVLTIGRLAGGRERNYLKKTRKLADIRGDQALLPIIHNLNDPRYRWTSKADNFSAWYHFWGTMLYAFFRDSTFVAVPLRGSWMVAGMIVIEESVGAVQNIMLGQWRALLDWPKRAWIDMQGAEAGSRIAAGLKARSPSWRKSETSRVIGVLAPLTAAVAASLMGAPAAGILLAAVSAGGAYLFVRTGFQSRVKKPQM